MTSDCSFPYTYNGGIYYWCTQDITSVPSLACIGVNDTDLPCDVDPGSYSSNTKGHSCNKRLYTFFLFFYKNAFL